jgi:hypothetical protein
MCDVGILERPKQGKRDFIPAGAEDEVKFFCFKKVIRTNEEKHKQKNEKLQEKIRNFKAPFPVFPGENIKINNNPNKN